MRSLVTVSHTHLMACTALLPVDAVCLGDPPATEGVEWVTVEDQNTFQPVLPFVSCTNATSTSTYCYGRCTGSTADPDSSSPLALCDPNGSWFVQQETQCSTTPCK
jgi:hypothetical protein